MDCEYHYCPQCDRSFKASEDLEAEVAKLRETLTEAEELIANRVKFNDWIERRDDYFARRVADAKAQASR